MSTDRELDEQLEQILERLMAGTGVKIHTGGRYQMGIELPEATEAVKSLLTEATHEAEIRGRSKALEELTSHVDSKTPEALARGDNEILLYAFIDYTKESLAKLQRTKNKEEGA